MGAEGSRGRRGEERSGGGNMLLRTYVSYLYAYYSCSCTCHEHEFLLFLLLREYLLFFAIEGSRRRLLPAKANYM